MKGYKFSVIVPIYNAERTLERCIQSLREQSIEDVEIILVNDGSTDGSVEILEYFAAVDPRISIINKKNGGVSSARNAGIEKAQGEFILFCDSDDYVDKKWIEKLYRATKGRKNTLPIAGYYSVDTNQKCINVGFEAEEEIAVKDFYVFCEENLFNIPWNKIFIREIIVNNKIRFEESVSLGEDLVFQLNYLKYVSKIVAVPEYLVYYTYRNENSLSNMFRENLWKENQYVMTNLMNAMLQFETDLNQYVKSYYKNYFYMVVTSCQNNMKNPCLSFLGKIRENNRILRSQVFAECIKKGDLSAYNKVFLKCYKSKSYFWVVMLEKAISFKDKICSG